MNRDSSKQAAWRSWSLVGDLVVGWIALYLAFQIRIVAVLPGSSATLPEERFAYFNIVWAWVVLSQPVALYFFGLYESRTERPRLEIARWVSLAVFFQTLTLATGLFLASQSFPRSVLLLFALLAWIYRNPKDIIEDDIPVEGSAESIEARLAGMEEGNL